MSSRRKGEGVMDESTFSRTAPGMNILDALDDFEIFAPSFADKDTWTAWTAFLASLFGLPMDDEQLAMFRECTGRVEPPTKPAREAWLVVGRKGGKSRILALVATFLASFVDWRKHLSVGERGVIMIVAQDRSAAGVIMGYISGNFHTVPMLERLIERETTDRIELSTRVSIRVHTCSIRGVRGPTVLAAVLDELAFWPCEDQRNPDEEILASVRPAMASIGGGMLIAASSPYARKGALFQAYNKHFSKENDPVLVWKAETRRMNPTIKQEVVDAAMEEDPQRYSAEYMAEFRGDIESFVGLDVIQGCTDRGVFERPPSGQFRYSGFVDPSGGSSDSFTLAISHQEGEHVVLDAIREIKAPFAPSAAVEELAAVLKTYRVARIRGDYYAGQWPAEAFLKHGIKYEPCPTRKSDLYRDVLPVLNSGKVRLLDHTRMRNQFVNLERRTARGGKDSIDHADGAHDDLANSVAGAVLAATAKKPTMSIGYGGPGSYGDGRIYWEDADEPREHSRVRIVHMSEKEWIEAKEKEHLR
jgi:hypothetical protein